MMKKVLIGGAFALLLLAIGIGLWARSILAQDGLRGAVTAQLSRALGHPVAIDAIDASVFPRVTIALQGVRIGDPVRIDAKSLNLSTGLGALLRRRIEHGSIRLDGARIELPLPSISWGSPAPEGDAPSEDGSLPVRIVSIDDIVLRDVEITSGGRTLRGDVEVSVQGDALNVRRVSLAADGMALEASGEITQLSGPVGKLVLKAEELDFNQLMGFVADFQAGAGLPEAPVAGGTGSPPATSTPMDVQIAMESARARFGTLVIENLSGQARATDERFALDPVRFDIFGGRYQGTLTFIPGDSARFDLAATLENVNVGSAMAFAGNPDLVTGTLSGRLELAGEGITADDVTRTALGSLRVDVADGVISNLGLLRAVILATSKRATSDPRTASRAEKFSRLGATFSIGNGAARTKDLRFESENLGLTAEGSIALDGSAIDLAGQAQLSEALTKEAGTDLVRYTSDQGRVTLPLTISGSASAPSVRIDVSAAAGRAIRNRATEEAQKAIQRGLGGLLR